MKKRISSFLLALLMVVSAVPVMATATVAVESEATLTADDFYVVDSGLKIWLDGTEASTVNLGAGTWASKVGDVVATLGGTWKAGRNEGSYRFDLQDRNMSYSLSLPITALPTEDYTIDMLTMTRGYTTNGDGVTTVYGGQYAMQASSFVIGPLMCDTFGAPRQYPHTYYGADCGDNDAAWYYSNGVDLYTSGGDVTANWASIAGKYGWGKRNRAFTYEGDYPSNIALKLDVTGTTAATYTFTQNGKNIHTINALQHGFTSVVSVDTATMKWVMFRGFPVEVYQFRVYDRVLNQTELNRNHFADLITYFDLDLSCLTGLSEDDVNDVVSTMSTVGFSRTKAETQAALEAIVAPMDAVNASENAYDGLYAAQSDLVVLLTAFDAENDTSLNLATGRWYNKKGDGTSYATLVDNTKISAWEIGQNGKGVGYTINNMTDLYKNRYTIGMWLPTDGMAGGNIAVEYVFAPNPVMQGGEQEKIKCTKTQTGTDEEGNPVYTTTYSHGGRWGAYNGETTSNFSFGGLQICQFILSENPEGASMTSRLFYSSRPWEESKPADNDPETRSYDWAYLFGTKDAWRTDVMTMTINRAVTPRDGGDYDLAEFTVMMDRVAQTAEPITNVTGKANSFQNAFHTVDQLNAASATVTAADAFFGIPAMVYSIRMYNRTLTEVEMKQNHAVDLMAYFGLDVTGFAEATAEAKARVYEAFAEKNFQASDLEVAVMQAAIDRAVEDSIVGVVVSQQSSDGTALRIVGALETMENVSRVGFVITFKNGELVKTFGEATAENTATVTKTVFSSVTASGISYSADALCAEYLYAAVVKGIPAGTYTVEVTPFYVTMEDAVITGETKSQTFTF